MGPPQPGAAAALSSVAAAIAWRERERHRWMACIAGASIAVAFMRVGYKLPDWVIDTYCAQLKEPSLTWLTEKERAEAFELCSLTSKLYVAPSHFRGTDEEAMMWSLTCLEQMNERIALSSDARDILQQFPPAAFIPTTTRKYIFY